MRLVEVVECKGIASPQASFVVYCSGGSSLSDLASQVVRYVDLHCSLCGLGNELLLHLFFRCDFASHLWMAYFWHMGVEFIFLSWIGYISYGW